MRQWGGIAQLPNSSIRSADSRCLSWVNRCTIPAYERWPNVCCSSNYRHRRVPLPNVEKSQQRFCTAENTGPFANSASIRSESPVEMCSVSCLSSIKIAFSLESRDVINNSGRAIGDRTDKYHPEHKEQKGLVGGLCPFCVGPFSLKTRLVLSGHGAVCELGLHDHGLVSLW
jgi:hypothetical protein